MSSNSREATIHDARVEMQSLLQARSPNYYDESRQLCLVRCFICDTKRGRENYGPAVASGRCAHCGWPEQKKAGTTRQDRINWLLAHQALWEGWPSTNSAEGCDRQKHIRIVEAMRAAGVVSPKTNWKDVNLTNLINDARKQRRHKNAGY